METRIYFKNGSQIVIKEVIYSIVIEDVYNGGFSKLHVAFINEEQNKEERNFNVDDISFFSNWN